jgi:fatty-acyl-CoA synthase
MSDSVPRPRSETLGDLLDEIATATPCRLAVVFRDERLDYADLKVRADSFARALLAAGVRRGDRVALLVTNRTEWLVTAFGAAKIGAVTAAISTFSTPRELGWTLEHCGASVLVTLDAFRGRSFLGALCDLCPELVSSAPGALRSVKLPALHTVVAVQGGPAAGVFSLADFLAHSAGVGAAELAAAQHTVRPEDICYILYTSGSTAAPKGVTLAHHPLIANGFDIGERMHLTAADRVWLAVPLFWSFGSANALPALMTHGGSIVLQESFEPGEAIALIERERCTVYYGMANMVRAMREHPSHLGRRLGAMRTGLTIGPPEDVAMTIEVVGAAELCNVYGATETYGNCAVADAHDPLDRRLYSQGLPLPGMTIQVVDPMTREALPADEVGELVVAGYVTPGYYRAPELDAAAFDQSGGFLTGDLGSIDRDGRVRFRGRLKEMIKTGGINVACRDEGDADRLRRVDAWRKLRRPRYVLHQIFGPIGQTILPETRM